MNKILRTALVIITLVANCFAKEFVVLASKSGKIRDIILASTKEVPFSGFFVREADDGLKLVFAKELSPSKFKTGTDWSNDLIFDNDSYSVYRRIDPHTGKARIWTCPGYWVAIRQVSDNNVSLEVLVLVPKISEGWGFNIHTFGFSRIWKGVPAEPDDTKALEDWILNILKKEGLKVETLSA